MTYRGTLFLQLYMASLNACDLKLAVRVQDRFTGTLTEQQALHVKTTDFGQTSQTFDYAYLLTLADLWQVDATVLVGRPV